MPEMHIKQLGFTKNKKRNTNYIYRNDLDEACFQHDIACGKYKDLTKRTELDKVASNPKYNGHERGLTSMDYKFFD